MAHSQRRSLRKASGGRYHYSRTKKKYELGGFFARTKLDKDKKALTIRSRGGNNKQVTLSANQINVTDKKGKTTKTEILNVIENPANPQLLASHDSLSSLVILKGFPA